MSIVSASTRTATIIPILSEAAPSRRVLPSASAVPSHPAIEPQNAPQDARQRPLRDLRISVTDRCNFRCTYCMPASVFTPDYPYLPRAELLSFDEITRFAKLSLGLGVKKIRLTGGEPLLRKNLPVLIEQLAALSPELEITLTTNAALLSKHAASLKSAGLHRITVSLDGLDDAVFKRMNDADFAVQQVLDGIAAAQAVGFTGMKVNCVVQRGVNLDQVLKLAAYFRGTGVVLRFIEFMDVGATNGWRLDQVVPSQTLVDLIAAQYPIRPIQANYVGEVAERWDYADGAGELGFISSVTQPFCGACSRMRLSTDGQLFTCLFASSGWDVRSLMRDGASSDAQIAARVAAMWSQRADNYSQVRSERTTQLNLPIRKVEMSYIGG